MDVGMGYRQEAGRLSGPVPIFFVRLFAQEILGHEASHQETSINSLEKQGYIDEEILRY